MLWREVGRVLLQSRLFRNIITIDLSVVLEELLAPLIDIPGHCLDKLSIKYYDDTRPKVKPLISRVFDSLQDTLGKCPIEPRRGLVGLSGIDTVWWNGHLSKLIHLE